MAYSGRTSYYQIPIAINDDLLEETENTNQMEIIDNLLEASIGVIGTGVIKEGVYVEVADTGTGRKVILNPSDGVSISAVLNSASARTQSQVVWERLFDGNFYYLYLKFRDSLYEDPKTFEVVSRTSPVLTSNKNFLFLATYDLTGGSPVLDTNPEAKIYAREFTKHIGTQFNPHTSTLKQKNLTITGSISGSLDTSQSFGISQGSLISPTSLITLNHAVSGIPLIKSEDEFVLGDVRLNTQLSVSGQTSFDNARDSIVGAINQNYADNENLPALIQANADAIDVNTININVNTANIIPNTSAIAQNIANIENSNIAISGNTANIAFNVGSISGNAINIFNNQASISGNAVSISGNIADIANNTADIPPLESQATINESNANANWPELNSLDLRAAALECAVLGLCRSSSSSSSSSS
jgi:hypothetical protein